MGTIFKISLRNLIQHKSKTIIIGSLITIAILLSFVGNTLLDSAQRSLKRTFTENFTADVLVTPSQIKGGIFGASQDGENGDSNGPPIIPMMKDYDKVYAAVKDQPGIASLTSQISAYVIYNLGDAGINFGLAFGIDPDNYFQCFDNVVVTQGRKLKSGEPGIMLHEKIVKTMKEENNLDLKVGDPIQLNNFGESGFKIREVPIVGIFHFKAGNERSFAFMQPNFIDVNTLRALKGKAILTAEDVKINDATKSALEATEDDFFNESTVTSTQTTSAKVDFDKLLGDKTKRADKAKTDEGAWNYILIKLKPGIDTQTFINDLNKKLEGAKLQAKAQDWVPSAQPDSGIFMGMGLIFNIIIWILAIVSVIIIMNTLVVSVMERTPEIGTMRALGAQKSFVRSMFIMETLSITAVFGVLGILLGFLVVIVLNLTGIAAPNDFMKLIFGGDVLRPDITFGQIGSALFIIIFIALVSWIFPVRMALKVSPLKAITAE